jgi:serine protease Do
LCYGELGLELVLQDNEWIGRWPEANRARCRIGFEPRPREARAGTSKVNLNGVLRWAVVQCAVMKSRLKAAFGLALLAPMLAATRAEDPPRVSPSPVQAGRGSASVDLQKGGPDTGVGASKSGTVPKPTPGARKPMAVAFGKSEPTSVADLKAMERHVTALVQRVSPAVVAVEVGLSSGSGVVISADGLVLCAGHVCGRPNREVHFTFPDGKSVRGKTLGVDLESDAGLMRITDRGPWPNVPMGELESAHRGDWVLALGHPGGFDLKRSLVVRLGRILRLEPDLLQTDCPISPGDSGGPLFDMSGRVIGIHSFISDSTTENFHVPIGEFYDGWDQLLDGEGGWAPEFRAYLGADSRDDAAGCRLSAVEVNGPGFNAGLRVGDLILRVEGRDIKSSATFQHWLADARPGDVLKLEIKRGDTLLERDVKLEPWPVSR